MKRTVILALTVAVSASFFTANAQKKDKKKKKEKVEETMPVVLTTPSDSISYAAGITLTNGLVPFLKQQYGVDEAYMGDFVRGFEEATKSGVTEATKAYGAGINIASMVKSRMLPGVSGEFKDGPDTIQAEMFYKGFMAALQNDSTLFKRGDAEKFFKDRKDAMTNAKNEANRKMGEDFLAANKTKEGVKTTASGLQYKVLVQGTGEIPTATDEVVVKYEGKLVDGTVFDSSYERKDPTNKFRANQVIKGWTEALTMMPVGSKWQLFIPQELAYGERNAGKIAPYSALIFTVELLGVEKPKAEPTEKTAVPSKATTKATAKKKGRK
ncbi:MAG: FKBP-type peptidyl-prolyl cis-trans isomerase [Prevotellaceae bacterium]|nr:FKBP-type peptidyl-prolyl cis-trans isomerase [Prevotella sp.]MDD7258022.1 FKBP-type peptidyl-prolyl cis-trans isomerase [Prevotellaceae bacterium]MDY6130528.1 FKBP-type peptidyl-prolyl cis-trans isomerase [Prevotella sp.]